jgi:hypothetical protein
MSDRNQPSVARRHVPTLALCAAVFRGAATPSLAVMRGGNGYENAGMRVDVLSERRCKWTPKEERCDWVKPDRKLATGH